MSFEKSLAAVALALLIVLILPVTRRPTTIATTQAGALAAISQIVEWAKWMSGIQTAAIAGLALMVFEKDSIRLQSLPWPAAQFALAAFVFLGVSLFVNAWILSAMPSHAIRVHARVIAANAVDPHFDIYEQPLFSWSCSPPLGYMLAAKHWLRASGLVAFGLFIGTLLKSGMNCTG